MELLWKPRGAGLALGWRASPQQGRRVSALSAGDSAQDVLFGFERGKRGREKPVPRTQKAVTQEALRKAAGQHAAEPPGPRRGGEHLSEEVCVHPPRAAGAASPRVAGPVLPPSARQGRF